MRADDDGAGVDFAAADGADDIVLPRLYDIGDNRLETLFEGIKIAPGGRTKNLQLILDILAGGADAFCGGCLSRADVAGAEVLQAANMRHQPVGFDFGQ